VGYWDRRTREEARADGFPWIYREVRLPRISDDLLDCSVYLYKTEKDAGSGTRAGGTGFLVGVPLGAPEPLRPPTQIGPIRPLGSWETPHIYAVTNAHNLNHGSYVVRLNTKEGATKTIPTSEGDWYRHPESDLAACPIHIQLDQVVHDYKLIPFSMIFTETEAELLRVGIGDDVVAIGRFVNNEHKQKNTPVARFGTVAAMPGFPIRTGEKGIKPQLSILAEVRTLPGYSGSPVFLRIPHWELLYGGDALRQQLAKKQIDDDDLPTPLLMLLGIAWGYIYGRNLPIKAGGKKIEGWKVEEVNTGMMAMVPAWKLLELLNIEKLAKRREKEAEKWHDEIAAGCP
jgi:hypothetical protein